MDDLAHGLGEVWTNRAIASTLLPPAEASPPSTGATHDRLVCLCSTPAHDTLKLPCLFVVSRRTRSRCEPCHRVARHDGPRGGLHPIKDEQGLVVVK